MSGQPYWESAVEKQIREAQERGDFDNLPGAGKPLDLSDSGDPDWWVKRFAEREKLDLGAALPGALALRREAAGYPESLVDVRAEEQVREILQDYNKRVLADRLRPAMATCRPLSPRPSTSTRWSRAGGLCAPNGSRSNAWRASSARPPPPLLPPPPPLSARPADPGGRACSVATEPRCRLPGPPTQRPRGMPRSREP
jgi:hypothetical protein